MILRFAAYLDWFVVYAMMCILLIMYLPVGIWYYDAVPEVYMEEEWRPIFLILGMDEPAIPIRQLYMRQYQESLTA